MHFGLTEHLVCSAPGTYVWLGDPASHARLLGPDGLPLQNSELCTRRGIDTVAALGI